MNKDQQAQLSEIIRQAQLRIDAVQHPKVQELFTSHPDCSLSINGWTTPPTVVFTTSINANNEPIDLIDYDVSCSNSEIWLNETIEIYRDNEVQINLDCTVTQDMPKEHRDLLRSINKIQTIKSSYETLVCS